MTAGQIAKQLNQTDVSICYLATEFLDEGQFHNEARAYPMKQLEFMVLGNSIEKMKEGDKLYQSEDFFPQNLTVTDSEEQKEMVCNAFPESEETGTNRTIMLEEHMRNKIQKEARENQGQSICYLVVSHGCHIDRIAKIYEL